MNADQSQIVKERAESVVERWQYIKAKCRREHGRPSNIEIHSPCLAAALNQMEAYMRLMEIEIQAEKTRAAENQTA